MRPQVPPSPKIQVQTLSLDEKQPKQVAEKPLRDYTSSPDPSVMSTPNVSEQTPVTTPGVSDGEQGLRWEPPNQKPNTYPTKIAGSTLDLERVGRMSFPQERLWFLRSYLSDPTTYNITLAYKLTGPLRVDALEQAFHATIERHETLRTAFYTDPSTGEAQQGIIAQSPFKLERIDITDDSQIEEEFRKINQHVYDLEHGDSMRAKLLKKDADNHILVMGYHHIALDATTSLLLVRDFAMIYSGTKLEPLKLQYVDYATKQRRLIKETGSKDIVYWKSEFPHSPRVLPFFDFGSVKLRKPLTEYKIRILERRLDAEMTSKLKTASQKMQVTGFHLHLAALQVLLHRLLKINDVCIGITDANKSDPDHFDTLGFFVNLLPIRSQIDGRQSFTSIARKAKDKTFQALAHSQLPFDVLLDELKIPRTTDHTPLFQVLMNYKMDSNRTVPLEECKAEAVKFEDASNPYDLQFDIEVAVDGTTLITATTQAHLYSDADLSTVMRTYCNIVQSVASNPSLPVSNHKLSNNQDIEAALEIGKGPRIKLDQSLTITSLFDRAVEQRSTNVAVVDNVGGCLTWNQMAARVHGLATHLLRLGVKANAFVAAYCEPTVNSVCYWLAIIRVGAIYVPLDVSNPTERLQLIVSDCKASAIICDEKTIDLARDFQIPNCHLFKLSDLNGLRPQFVRDASHHSSIACVIYTSGTTGMPKGTMLSNSNLVNHMLGVNARYGMSQEIVLQSTNLGFDLSLAQMMQFMASQGKLVVASSQSRNDAVELAKLMVQHDVTYTIATPSVYTILLQQRHESLQQCRKWRFAFSCGEALAEPVIKGFQALKLPELRFINSCGPTEITIINSAWQIPLEDPNAIGHVMNVGTSLPNYFTYILDESGRPLPLGFAGEMVCGGASISQGYLGKKELTATKWLPDPFASPEDQANGWNRMYRTGDKAKLLPDGQLVFLGRIEGDQQIKLRGVRIELDDITNTIIRHVHGDICEAAVILQGEGEAAFLVAFVVLATKDTAERSDDWKKNLIAGLPLPASMKPNRLVVLPNLPRTANGKIDRKALQIMPLPSLGEDKEEDVGLTMTESTLKTIWTNSLPSTMPATFVRKNTDFFRAGGNSMLLVGIQAKIGESFGASVPLFKLFQASTLANMAALIDASTSPEVKTKVDWELTTSLDKALFTQQGKSSDPKPIMNVGVEILLTGSTGFLGARILQELVADERVAAIHCLAIRKSRSSTSRPLASNSSKIIKYYGDLASDRLGLSEESFDDLAQNVDRIIHNGADVSFLKAYSTLEQTNLGSTKQLARLAIERKIPFHFVSTAGVAQFFPSDELPEAFIPANNTPPTDIIGGGSGGYAASKWASERYLQECSEKLGLPVCVHRPSNILGAGAENVNMTANVIEYSLRIGAAPETPNLKGYMQFVSVDEVGQGLVDSLFSTNAGAAEARVIHHCSDEKVQIANLKEYLENKYNRKLLNMDLAEWVEQAKAKGLTEQVAMMMLEVLRNADGTAQMKVLSRRSKRLSTALTSWFQEIQQ